MRFKEFLEEGSNKKEKELSVPEKHQLKVARDILKAPDTAVPFMGGGLTKAEAREIIKRLTGKIVEESDKLKGFYVMGKHQSVAWYPVHKKEEAEKHVKQLNYRGGADYKLEPDYGEKRVSFDKAVTKYQDEKERSDESVEQKINENTKREVQELTSHLISDADKAYEKKEVKTPLEYIRRNLNKQIPRHLRDQVFELIQKNYAKRAGVMDETIDPKIVGGMRRTSLNETKTDADIMAQEYKKEAFDSGVYHAKNNMPMKPQDQDYPQEYIKGYKSVKKEKIKEGSLLMALIEGKTYSYNVNLDERGSFYADVRDPKGKTVFNVRGGEELEPDESSLVDDGFMKNFRDVQGLQDYLRDVGVIGKADRILHAKDIKEAVEIPADVSMEKLESMFDAAKRALGIANRLKDSAEKKKHLSQVMKGLNKIRNSVMKMMSDKD